MESVMQIENPTPSTDTIIILEAYHCQISSRSDLKQLTEPYVFLKISNNKNYDKMSSDMRSVPGLKKVENVRQDIT